MYRNKLNGYLKSDEEYEQMLRMDAVSDGCETEEEIRVWTERNPDTDWKYIRGIRILNSQAYLEKTESGKWEYVIPAIGSAREVEDENIEDILEEYLDIKEDAAIDLEREEEDDIKAICKWLEG